MQKLILLGIDVLRILPERRILHDMCGSIPSAVSLEFWSRTGTAWALQH